MKSKIKALKGVGSSPGKQMPPNKFILSKSPVVPHKAYKNEDGAALRVTEYDSAL